MNKITCSAISKQSGKQCRRLAAPGRTVCVIHGGASISPCGGAYAQLYTELMTDEERDIYDNAPTDPVLVLEHCLKLLQVKLFKIIKKQVQLTAAGSKIDPSWYFDHLTSGKVDGKSISTRELVSIADKNERKELSVVPDDKVVQLLAADKGFLAVMDQIQRTAGKLHKMKNPTTPQINVVGQVVSHSGQGEVGGTYTNVISDGAIPVDVVTPERLEANQGGLYLTCDEPVSLTVGGK